MTHRTRLHSAVEQRYGSRVLCATQNFTGNLSQKVQAGHIGRPEEACGYGPGEKVTDTQLTTTPPGPKKVHTKSASLVKNYRLTRNRIESRKILRN